MSKINVSRRDFLKAAGIGAAALGLTACGGSSSTAASSTAASSAAGSTASAGGSNWPTDTVSFYVPAKAGGGTDMLGRVFLQALNEVHPGNYIVVNDVTGGGSVAAETVRNAKPDGLNLLMYHTGLCVSYASGQYAHTLDEFRVIGLFSTPSDEAAAGMFVPGNSPFNSFDELLSYAKEHPGELMAGVQTGTTSALLEAMFEKEFDFKATSVDAGSNADKVTALMGNQIDFCLMNTTGNDQYVQSGDLKCLVTMGTKGCKRSSIIPDTPTLDELYPDNTYNNLDMLCYIAGPKDMSDEDVQTISEAMKAACETDTVKEGYKKLSATVEWVSPEDATELLKASQEATIEAYKLANG